MDSLRPCFKTAHGCIVHADAVAAMRQVDADSVDLIVTSPPFALLTPKTYGNPVDDEYLNWFRPFAAEMHRILAASGSLALDLGGTWLRGQPTRSLYHFKLLIMLCEEFGFHLAQEFYWWNPAKLPSPAEWVNKRRIRVKDAVNTIWWLSKSAWPRASNRRVLLPYSESMQNTLGNDTKPTLRPSGHDISAGFLADNGGAVPPNLIAIPNTESNSQYQRYCRERGIRPHPARFPTALPEFFIRMTTDLGDVVLDPFAGSCATGEACETLQRRWTCIDSDSSYLDGAIGRFSGSVQPRGPSDAAYTLPHPGALWNGLPRDRLLADGGQTHKPARA